MSNFIRVCFIIFLFVLLPFISNSNSISELVELLDGSVIIAQDSENTYLGKITNKYDGDSIFNEYGRYGSKYSSVSIWNEYSFLGSKYSLYSPFNEFSTQPPVIVKNRKIIGYLTTNESISNSVSPLLLKAIEKKF